MTKLCEFSSQKDSMQVQQLGHLGEGLFLVILTGVSWLGCCGGPGLYVGGAAFLGTNSGMGWGGFLAATGTMGGPVGLKSILDTFLGGTESGMSNLARASDTDAGILVSSSPSTSIGVAPIGSGLSMR